MGDLCTVRRVEGRTRPTSSLVGIASQRSSLPPRSLPAAGEKETAEQRAARLEQEALARRAAAGEREQEAQRKEMQVGGGGRSITSIGLGASSGLKGVVEGQATRRPLPTGLRAAATLSPGKESCACAHLAIHGSLLSTTRGHSERPATPASRQSTALGMLPPHRPRRRSARACPTQPTRTFQPDQCFSYIPVTFNSTVVDLQAEAAVREGVPDTTGPCLPAYQCFLTHPLPSIRLLSTCRPRW